MESSLPLKEEEIEQDTLNIIITGCIHGSLDKMYKDIKEYSSTNNKKIDMVLCTGDFECMRTEKDLTFLSCPEKYREMGDFYKYYTSKTIAPYLTIFIGGNHEASNYLEQNYYGGWVAPNIYYLGRSGVINVKGIRIGGISGIFNKYDYFRGNFEKDEDDIKGDKKSIFHLREFDVVKMSHVKNKIDIFMTHDWPTNLVGDEDKQDVFKKKPHFKNDILEGTLGSFPGEFLLKYLKPNFFICGHMHFYYSNKINETEIFAFDKCLNKRHYFGLIEVKKSLVSMDINDNDIYIDPEWMSITHTFNQYFPTKYDYYSFYNLFDKNARTIYNEIVLKKFKMNLFFKYKYDDIDIDEIINDLLKDKFTKKQQIKDDINEQTKLLLNIFDIDNDNNNHYLSKMYLEFFEKNEEKKSEEKNDNKYKIKNKDEINFDI